MRVRGSKTTALTPPLQVRLSDNTYLPWARRSSLFGGTGGRLRYRQRRLSPLRSCAAMVTSAWSLRPLGSARTEASSERGAVAGTRAGSRAARTVSEGPRRRLAGCRFDREWKLWRDKIDRAK